jgi:hypothetical protein
MPQDNILQPTCSHNAILKGNHADFTIPASGNEAIHAINQYQLRSERFREDILRYNFSGSQLRLLLAVDRRSFCCARRLRFSRQLAALQKLLAFSSITSGEF